jgi:cation-transporting ATPase E
MSEQITATTVQQFEGLTEAEAALKKKDRRTDSNFRWAQRTYISVLRQNVLSIFNITMIVMAVSQVLLNDILGALVTLLVLLLGFGINMLQQLLAAFWLRKNAKKNRPLATVIREGKMRGIDQDEVVPGDLLVIGPGDEIIADGRLLSDFNLYVDEISSGDGESSQVKQRAAQLQAGSYGVRGWGVYQVERLPSEQLLQAVEIDLQARDRKYTPLQNIITRILQVMLTASLILFVIVALDALNVGFMPAKVEEAYRGIISIVFSIAPSGLFFTVIISYAVGSAFLSRPGALVRNTRAVETLAQVNTLCVSKGSTLSGGDVKIDLIPSVDGTHPIPESRVRQILGDYVHSTTIDNYILRVLSGSLEGEKLPVQQQVNVLSILGWEALTFTTAELKGTYVIGYPDSLGQNLIVEETAAERPTAIKKAGVEFKQASDHFLGFIQRGIGKIRKTAPTGTDVDDKDQETDMGAEADTAYRRAAAEETRLLFAYSPEPQDLYDNDQNPVCPDDLIPVCYLSLVEQVNPHLEGVINEFVASGVAVKIVSSDEPQRVLAAARQIGLSDGDAQVDNVVVGADLIEMDDEQLNQTTREHDMFAALSPSQKVDIVSSFRRGGEFVAMVGDRVSDLQAMRASNISVAVLEGSQITKQIADIVITKKTEGALPAVLHEGQRVVNGVLSILKLNLAQVTYILIMLLVFYFTDTLNYFYHSSHNGVIYFVTVLLPSLSLSLFAPSRAIPTKEIAWRLVHFFVPAGITISIAAMLLNLVFRITTDDVFYTQVATMQAVMTMGLLLVVFVQPPTKFWVGGAELSGTWWPTIMAVFMWFLFQIVAAVPAMQDLLKISTLNSILDYLVVLGFAFVWAMVIRTIWRRSLFGRGVGTMARWLASGKTSNEG